MARHSSAAFLLPVLVLLPTVSAAAPSVGNAANANRFTKYTTDEALTEFYSLNLEKDFAPHRQGPLYTLGDIFKTVDKLRTAWRADFRFLVVVRGGVMRVAVISGQAPALASSRVRCQLQNAGFAIGHKAPFPDTIFLFNVWDQPMCHVSSVRQSPCFAPVMSVYKDKDHNADLLIPHPCYKYEDLKQYPWKKKIPKAFMRASVYGNMAKNCTRVQLYNLSLSERGKKWLDVGIVFNQHQELPLPISERVPLSEHTKWKYLINGDGVVASSRLGSLLGMDSPILKSSSNSVEYYYRSLTAGVHYVPFKADASDILDVIEGLEQRDTAELQGIAHAARTFQQKYLNRYAKTLYMRKVLTSYNELFGPGVVSSFVASLDVEQLNNTQYLLEQLSKAASAQPLGSGSGSSGGAEATNASTFASGSSSSVVELQAGGSVASSAQAMDPEGQQQERQQGQGEAGLRRRQPGKGQAVQEGGSGGAAAAESVLGLVRVLRRMLKCPS